MNDYEEGMQLLETAFGQGKDNVIALGTIALEPSAEGNPRPVVRGVDAYYQEGVFYVTTNKRSNKMQQIGKNSEVSIASCSEMFTATGIGEDRGWVLAPQNAELRTKLRKAFAPWYDSANNEQDEACCILALRLTQGMLNVNHWEKLYHLDFADKTARKTTREASV